MYTTLSTLLVGPWEHTCVEKGLLTTFNNKLG